MKKYLLTFLAVFALTFTTKAQINYFGVKGGLCLTNLNFPIIHTQAQGAKRSFKQGAYAALTYDILFKKNLLFGLEVSYVGYGIKSQFSTIGLLHKYEEQYDYISVPLKFGFQTDGKFYAFGQFGFVASVLVNQFAKSETVNTDGQIEHIHYSTSLGFITPIDIAALGEIGIGYKYKKIAWFSAFGFRHSLSKLQDSRYVSERRFYNFLFSTGVKYQLITKKPNNQD
jgi:hypothetical protein